MGLTTVFAKGLMPELGEVEVRSREGDADYIIDGLHELVSYDK